MDYHYSQLLLQLDLYLCGCKNIVDTIQFTGRSLNKFSFIHVQNRKYCRMLHLLCSGRAADNENGTVGGMKTSVVVSYHSAHVARLD